MRMVGRMHAALRSKIREKEEKTSTGFQRCMAAMYRVHEKQLDNGRASLHTTRITKDNIDHAI